MEKILAMCIAMSMIATAAPSKWSVGDIMSLPDMPSDIKFCTDYRCYNIEDTPQKYIQDNAETDEYGLRVFNGDYCVGLGTAYSETIGDRFYVELETGKWFTIIVSDIKADDDTDLTNRYTPCINYEGERCANILEFIMDKNSVDEKMYAYGSVSYYEAFEGDVVKLIYVGRSSDPGTYWESCPPDSLK